MKMTLSNIREAVTRAGSHHFDRKTLSFFGETMKSYRAYYHEPTGLNILIRHTSKAGPDAYAVVQADPAYPIYDMARLVKIETEIPDYSGTKANIVRLVRRYFDALKRENEIKRAMEGRS